MSTAVDYIYNLLLKAISLVIIYNKDFTWFKWLENLARRKYQSELPYDCKDIFLEDFWISSSPVQVASGDKFSTPHVQTVSYEECLIAIAIFFFFLHNETSWHLKTQFFIHCLYIQSLKSCLTVVSSIR